MDIVDVYQIHDGDQFKQRVICNFPAGFTQTLQTAVLNVYHDIFPQKVKKHLAGGIRVKKR